MKDVDNYYEIDPENIRPDQKERYPENHVRFSPLLQPLHWIDALARLFGGNAFPLKKSILKEYDSAAPFDSCLGTSEELAQIRAILETFCRGIDNNPFLSSIGRFLGRKITLNAVKNRKRILQFYQENRDFIESKGKLTAPVIITGLPRTGSTLLQRLLSEDPNTRSPYTFEMENPLPPLTSGANPLEDARITKSGSATAALTRFAPGFMEKLAQSHLWSPVEIEESLIYMMAHNGIFVMSGPAAGREYANLVSELTHIRPVFRYERLFFTMLDAYCPALSHWTLKAPSYASYFPNIFEEYPDARVVLTHRNPLITMPSTCRIFESWCIAFDKNHTFDKHRFAQFLQNRLGNGLKAPFKYRKEHPEKEGQIFDCMYQELFNDPIAVVKSIYRKFDLEYTKDFEDKMRIYLQNNKQGKYGRHRYSLEEYGFDRESLYLKYKDYMDTYGFSASEKSERPGSFSFSM